jgi:hypothetical protein
VSPRKDRNPVQRAERLIRELEDGAYDRARRGEREVTDPQTAATGVGGVRHSESDDGRKFQTRATRALARFPVGRCAMVPDRGLSVDLRQPASFLAGVGAIATSPTLRTATDRTGAWRWRPRITM